MIKKEGFWREGGAFELVHLNWCICIVSVLCSNRYVDKWRVIILTTAYCYLLLLTTNETNVSTDPKIH